LPIGKTYSISDNPKTVNYSLGVGFYTSTGDRDVWFTLAGTASIIAGSETTVTFRNPSIAQLLSGFAVASDWQGDYWDGNLALHRARFRFTNAGTFTLYDGSTLRSTGTVQLVSWPNRDSIVTFRICAPTCGAGIRLPYPFGNFKYANGPASWPIIDYYKN